MKFLCTLLLISLTSLTFAASPVADTVRIEDHLRKITKTETFRTFPDTTALNQTAGYIFETFSAYSKSVSYQTYPARGREYKNVICTFGPADAPRIVVGAHYDVCGDQEGADDNASGVVGLLELARMLAEVDLSVQVELVAYSLEEPPNFRSEYMGSYIHAKSLHDAEADVIGMVCLEMIGYFSDEKKSQDYPVGLMKLFYGGKGDFVLAAKKFSSGRFAKRFGRKLKRSKQIRTQRITAPKFIPGTDFSDHLNYWKFKYSALMITDSAFYRNDNYHETTDTMETLNLPKMAKVIDGIYLALLDMNEKYG